MDQTNKFIQISKPSLIQRQDSIELSALVTASDNFFEPFKLWYRFPLEYKDSISLTGDPFLAAVLPMAMTRKYNLRIEAPTSKQLYTNCSQIMKILSGWFENMKRVQLQVGFLQPVSNKSKAVGSFFTGGVDSFYTVLKNLKEFNNEMRISHLVYVYGFDISIENNELYQSVKKEIVSISRDLALTPLFIKTNLRLLTDWRTKWGEQQHGAALASVGLALSKLFKILFIPSSYTFLEMHPWGSHPLLDPLWSNEGTHFIHDGNEANRSQKIIREIGSSKTALNHLRVCWENPDDQYNCGVCGKCIRTKINLKLAGVLEQCKTLDNVIDLEKYAAILKHNETERHMLAEIISNLNGNVKDDQFKRSLLNLSKIQQRNYLSINQIRNKMKNFLQK